MGYRLLGGTGVKVSVLCFGTRPSVATRTRRPIYSLLKRQAEVELLPLARHAGLGVCPYNAMAGGLLSGKYGGARPAQGRLGS